MNPRTQRKEPPVGDKYHLGLSQGADTVQTPSNVDLPVSFESVHARFSGSGKVNVCTYLFSHY